MAIHAKIRNAIYVRRKNEKEKRVIQEVARKQEGGDIVRKKCLSWWEQHRLGVLYQEMISAKRNIEGIRRDIKRGDLPENHPSLAKNIEKYNRAKAEYEKILEKCE